MTYIIVPEAEKELEWDQRKSDRNHFERDLPFDLAAELFRSPTLERRDLRWNYGEVRMLTIGMADSLILLCVYTDRGLVRRIISLRPANRKERDDYRKAFYH